MKDLVIIGAGGLARETAWLVKEINVNEPTWRLLGFLDRDESKWRKVHNGVEVIGGLETIKKLSNDFYFVCAIAEPSYKKRIVSELSLINYRYATLIHPEVKFSPTIKIGEGVIIQKGTILTTDIIIGDHVSVNPCCGIGHDVVIEDYVTLMWRVNLSGAVRVREGCMLGTGVTVLQEKTISEYSVVGAGAVVTKDLPANCTAAGVPAKIIK